MKQYSLCFGVLQNMENGETKFISVIKTMTTRTAVEVAYQQPAPAAHTEDLC